ncbi:ABC transporter ATP-binding protein [Roseateles depolymerans]|uniref:Sugar ABC transporter ATP-binding protein n=1 Tax=Roseateles depolymerans TaxID=76731 RepID=A0A0U3LGR7_9BURK|nr:ABC transporter ATP-binding protein [Roseateles depolymerans]ALV07279.1 sugar ABC transporter ATP-binding protein [Roseateles depolymerans]REG20262.1 multiple sugar transport system ATP-binding protein [Roseateles depolymerans]
MGQVTLRSLRKRYGDHEVIQGIDLEVRDGEFIVFVGPSGCGKSTTLRMIAGLEEIDSGELLIDGVRANEQRPADRGAAMVFQSYALYPHMTVAENMGFALKMAGVRRAERDEQVRRTAEVLRITDLLDRTPRQLSGGQRQRVAIGRAIVRKPKVFLFDEPLSNLDAALRVDMRIELTRLHQQLGTTMIYVTHDQVEAMTMGDRIAVFHQGRIEQVGTPMALYRQPANAFVAGFLGAPRINMVERPPASAAGAARQLWALLGGAGWPGAARLGIRPEHLSVVPAPADAPIDATSAQPPTVPATVVLAEHLGDVSLLHLQVDGVQDLIAAKLPMARVPLRNGDAVRLGVQSPETLAFDAQARALASHSAEAALHP